MRWTHGICIAGLMVGNAFALSGTVKDGQGAAIEGASVYLVSNASQKATTNAAGEFSLASSGVSSRAATPLRLQVEGRRLVLPGSFGTAVVSLVGPRGERVGLRQEGGGADAAVFALPELTPGMFFLVAEVAGQRSVATLLATGSGSPVALEAGPSFAARAMAASDTVVAEKSGYTTVRKAVASASETGVAIVLAKAGTSPLPAISDYTLNGPFNTVVEANVGPNGKYTVFRPEPLGKDGFLHAPIVYGPGISTPVSSSTNFLKIIASHGFVIVGCNMLTGGPNDAGNNTTMRNGLTWIVEQNGTAGSKYQGKIATTKGVTMGYSVGGTAAVDIADHAAVATTVSIHGHISKTKLHGPLLQTSGTKDNVGLPMQQQTFANSNVQTFLGTVTGADHGYIMQNNGGAERPAIVAWLRYWIYNDEGGKKYFYGTDCVMCKSPWENPQRKNWQ